jgi:protein SCO1/2
MMLALLLAASPPASGIVENLNARVPLELTLTDHLGNPVRLSAQVRGDVPVVVTPVYFGCPALCPLTLHSVAEALKATGLELGRDYRVITYSIDPADGPAQAKEKRRELLNALGAPEHQAGWEVLTGASARLSEALGFRYAPGSEARQYAHTAAFMVLTPDGRISRYLYGVQVPPRELRLALVEASSGRVGTAFDRVLLTCLRFDAAAGGYTFGLKGALRATGLVILLSFGSLLGALWRRELRRARV